MEQNDVKLRIMLPSDYEGALALWRSVPGMGLRRADDSKEGIERFLARNPKTCFVAESGGRVVGCILSGNDGRRGYIYHTAVDIDFRHRGIGTRLVEAAVNALREEGITRVCLNVLESNRAGQEFWLRLGWEKQGFLGFYSRGISDVDNSRLYEV